MAEAEIELGDSKAHAAAASKTKRTTLTDERLAVVINTAIECEACPQRVATLFASWQG